MCTKSYAGVICPEHGKVDIDYQEYMNQMFRPNERWVCPICKQIAEFDYVRYEEINL